MSVGRDADAIGTVVVAGVVPGGAVTAGDVVAVVGFVVDGVVREGRVKEVLLAMVDPPHALPTMTVAPKIATTAKTRRHFAIP